MLGNDSIGEQALAADPIAKLSPAGDRKAVNQEKKIAAEKDVPRKSGTGIGGISISGK